MNLTPSQLIAARALEGKSNVFLTGGAGTGKSFLIRHFLKEHSSEKIPVLASTGAAAILLGGRTFHSFFGLGILQGGAQAVFNKAQENKKLKKRLQSASTIIIDEVSMLSHSAVDCAESIARSLRGSDEPWGGLKVIAVGDFAQLPPVSRGSQKEWAFLGEAWASSGFKTLQLTDFVRTEDEDFLRVLEQIRRGELSDEVRDFLDAHTLDEVDPETPHLFSRRDHTERFNLARLAEIDDESRVYETKYFGESRYQENLMREAPIPPTLELKRGALVMIRVNDPKQRFVNGTMARVRSLYADSISVETESRTLELEPFSFSYVDADGKECAHAVNFPVTLAYASTIHKIQGATLDRAHIDLGQIWEPGQAYVALSRVRRGKNLSLSRWSESAIRVDPDVLAFYNGMHGVSSSGLLRSDGPRHHVAGAAPHRGTGRKTDSES